jgi:hypothetical protein
MHRTIFNWLMSATRNKREELGERSTAGDGFWGVVEAKKELAKDSG